MATTTRYDVSKRDDRGTYRCIVWLDTRPKATRIERSFKLERDAKTFGAKTVADFLAGGHRPKRREDATNLADIADDWIASYRHAPPSTGEKARWAWQRHIADEWGDLAFADLEHADLDLGRWLDSIRLADNTVASLASNLSSLLNYAVRGGNMRRNPLENATRERKYRVADPRERDAKEVVELEPAEVVAWRDAVLPQHRIIIDLCSLAGLRISEACALTPEQIRYEHRRGPHLWIDRQVDDSTRPARLDALPKYGKKREVPLGDLLATRLLWHQSEHGLSHTGQLVANLRGGAMKSDNVKRLITPHAPSAATLHALRHFYTTMLVADPNLTPTMIARYLGHKDDRLLQWVYTHRSADADAAARARTDAIFGESLASDTLPAL